MSIFLPIFVFVNNIGRRPAPVEPYTNAGYGVLDLIAAITKVGLQSSIQK